MVDIVVYVVFDMQRKQYNIKLILQYNFSTNNAWIIYINRI